MVLRITLLCKLTTPESIRAEINFLEKSRRKLTDTGLIRIVDGMLEVLREKLETLK